MNALFIFFLSHNSCPPSLHTYYNTSILEYKCFYNFT
nr:MAG TPA: hypothetical protein [Caudoviricetes sp.]